MKHHERAKTRVAQGGRVVIPASVRRQLGLVVGAEVVITVEDDHAVVANAKSARRRAKQLVRRMVPKEVSLSNELMAERKREAGRE